MDYLLLKWMNFYSKKRITQICFNSKLKIDYLKLL